jgi:hypothetical protein
MNVIGKLRSVSIFRRYAPQIIMIVLSLASGLLVIEFGLRLTGWPAPGLYLSGQGPLELRPAGLAGGAYPPNSTGRLLHYDYDVEWSANSHGFRERPLQAKFPAEWRIGFLGDSFVAGVGVELDQRFGEISQKAIGSLRPHTTIWNLGSPACGTACEAATLQAVGDEYELDEIVLAFYGGNDLEDNVLWMEHQGRSLPPVAIGRPLNNIREWMREHARITTFLWIRVLRGLATFYPPGAYDSKSFHQAWHDTEVSLGRLKEIVGLRRLTILYLPATPEWDDSIWRAVQEHYGFSDRDRFLTKEALRRWADDHRVEFADATAWLRACPTARECTFPVDGHWNSRGHLLVGKGLASYLMNQKIIKATLTHSP